MSKNKSSHSGVALTAASAKRALKQLVNPEKAAFYPTFFKTGKGQYGEGDKFLGVVVPDQKKVARKHKDLPLGEIRKLLDDKFHECRLTGIFVLVNQFEKSKEPKVRQQLCDFYVDNLD